MTTLALFLGFLAATVAVLGTFLTVRVRVLGSLRRDRVIVTLKSGDSFAGVLSAHDRKALVLAQAEALGAGENRTNLPLDGELIVLLPDVAHIQRP